MSEPKGHVQYTYSLQTVLQLYHSSDINGVFFYCRACHKHVLTQNVQDHIESYKTNHGCRKLTSRFYSIRIERLMQSPVQHAEIRTCS